MRPERGELYTRLEARIGNTPLIESHIKLPNGNRLFVKRECDNPFGSHYDRAYLLLFREYEEQGKIKPGDKVLETTSGSAGVSFAGIGKLLGFVCHVAIPAGGEKARERAILEHLNSPDKLMFTPAELYVSGFPAFAKRYLAEHQDVVFLNHSMGKFNKKKGEVENNEVALSAFEALGREIKSEVDADYAVLAFGNGSSILGTIRGLSDKTRIIGFEHVQSGAAHEIKWPGKYEKEFGIKPGTLPRHKLPGTSYPGIEFPHILNAIRSGRIEDIQLVSDKETDLYYKQLTGKSTVSRLPHWDDIKLQDLDLGRSTKAAIAVTLKLAKKMKNKKIVIIAYDKPERYDN